MAPVFKLPEKPLGNGMLYETKHSTNKGKFWRWFLAGTLVNLCITSVVVGATVFYVHKELQSVKDQLRIHDDRLAWLEQDASSKPDAVRKNVPTWNNAQLRQRRGQYTQESTDHIAKQNATLLSRPAVPGNAGFCSCLDGRDGRDGKDGRDGLPGAACPHEVKGDKGDMGIDEGQRSPRIVGPRRLKRDVSDGNSSLTPAANQETRAHDVKPSGGDTYVRWGRTTCPYGQGTELVYAGIAAGSHYTHKGGSTDFFCLPTEPNWAESFNDVANSQSYLYGMEYEIAFDPFSHENAEFLNNRDVPCAVCRLVDRGTQLLFPAKLGCPNNWTEEYRGFLMSGRHSHEQRSRAVCVDEAPEAIPGSQASVDGALLYIIEGQCGALLCPPYVAGREITCSVCSI